MANFTIDGLDRLEASIGQLSSITDGELLSEVVLPAAERLVSSMQEKASSMMNVITGALMNSVKITGQGSLGSGVFAQVGPDQGKHPHASTGKRKRNAQGGGGGKYAGTNAEVGFILEYGSARIPAKHWMETACNEAEAELFNQLEAGLDEAFAAAGL